MRAISLPKFKLKWPNDIFINDSKNGGILIEKNEKNLIAGIGVNVLSIPKINSPEYKIGCISQNGSKSSPEKLLDLFICEFWVVFSLYKTNRSEIFKIWEKNALWFGESVLLNTDSKKISGIFNGIDQNGAIIIDQKTYFSGSLRKKS